LNGSVLLIGKTNGAAFGLQEMNSAPEGSRLALQPPVLFDDSRKQATGKKRMACEQGRVFGGAAGF
jgi:hypothetical protein